MGGAELNLPSPPTDEAAQPVHQESSDLHQQQQQLLRHLLLLTPPRLRPPPSQKPFHSSRGFMSPVVVEMIPVSRGARASRLQFPDHPLDSNVPGRSGDPSITNPALHLNRLPSHFRVMSLKTSCSILVRWDRANIL